MLIGFDLDGTLTDWNGYWIPKVERYLGYSTGKKAYSLEENFNLTTEEADKICSLFGADYDLNAPMKPYMNLVFMYLEQKEIDYCIISNRLGNGAIRGEMWFEDNILNELSKLFDNLHFKGYYWNDVKTIKAPICKKLNIDLMIEDAEYQLTALDKVHIPIIKMVETFNTEAPGIPCKNGLEVIEAIKKQFQLN